MSGTWSSQDKEEGRPVTDDATHGTDGGAGAPRAHPQDPADGADESSTTD